MFTRTFIIIRYKCHLCIYLLVTVIFAVVSCTITLFIKTYLIFTFLILFWWLWTFFNKVIFRSTSKTIPRRIFHTSVIQITRRTRFLIFLSDTFETFFCRMVGTSAKITLCLDTIYSLTISTAT